MNKVGFSVGFGYGAGMAIGVVGGMAACGIGAAVLFGGYLAIKGCIARHKLKKIMEENA